MGTTRSSGGDVEGSRIERAIMVINGEGGIGKSTVVRASFGGFVEGIEVVYSFVMGFKAFFSQVGVSREKG